MQNLPIRAATEQIVKNKNNIIMNRADMIVIQVKYEEESALPKSPLPARPFLIRYIAQDRGPELEKAPGFMLQSSV